MNVLEQKRNCEVLFVEYPLYVWCKGSVSSWIFSFSSQDTFQGIGISDVDKIIPTFKLKVMHPQH